MYETCGKKFEVRFIDQTKQTISKQTGHNPKLKPKFPGLRVSHFVRDGWKRRSKVPVNFRNNTSIPYQPGSSAHKVDHNESKQIINKQSRVMNGIRPTIQGQVVNQNQHSGQILEANRNDQDQLNGNMLINDSNIANKDDEEMNKNIDLNESGDDVANNAEEEEVLEEEPNDDTRVDDNNTDDDKYPSMDQFLDYPFSVEDTKLLEKELSGLIQSAKSYGFSGLPEDKDILDQPQAECTFDFELSNHSADDDSSNQSPSEDSKNTGLESAGSTSAAIYPKPLSDTQIFSLKPINSYNEFRLINHYCRVMCSFYSVKDPAWNFYTYVCDRFVCRYDPLKYALLAWSALHLSIIEETSFSVANKYYSLSLRAVMGNNTLLHGDVPMELFLATAYFLVHFDIMAGTKHAYQILRYVWSTLRIGRFFQSGPGPTLSPFGYQIVVWLLYLDIRSSLFVGNISFPDYILKQDRNPNIEYLSTSDIYEKRAILNIFSRSRKLLSGAYGSKYPKEYSVDDEIQEKILILMVRNMMMFGRLIRLRNWLNQCGNSTEFDANSLRNEISDLYNDNQNLLQYSGKSRMSFFHVLIENALIYSIIIYFDRICYPDIRTNGKCQKAASEILKIAVQLKKLRSHGTPGSTQWPFPLFIAGVETTDVIYQKWIVEELKECDEEGWGLHLGKMRKLYRECIKKQEETQRRVDIGDIMEKITGVFFL